MAESSAATQSPSVSSSSSGAEPSGPGNGGSPGACPALGAKSCGSSCADSFVSSSSQPVSLFSTSQEGLTSLCSDEPPSEIMTSSFLSSSEILNPDLTTMHGQKSEMLGSQPVTAKEGNNHLALLDLNKMEKPQRTSEDIADCPVSLAAAVPHSCPGVSASCPEHPAFLSKEAGQIEEQINEDQEFKNPNEIQSRENKTALDVDDRLTLLTAQKPPTEQQSKAEGICTNVLSLSEVSGGGFIEKVSPESPFEVIFDQATFDREFKDSCKKSPSDLVSGAVHSEGDSPLDLSETNDKVFPLRSKEAGRYPPPALFTRQFSHTTAALEEVSRCVNDMHNFTNEILTWDLVPQRTDKSDRITECTGLDRSDCCSEIPVVNLNMNTYQKTPGCSVNGSTALTKSTIDWAEDSLPQENTPAGKSMRACLNSTKEASGRSVQDSTQKQVATSSQLPGSLCEKHLFLAAGVATVKVTLPGGHLKDETNWQNSVLGEISEADSSGESDDTVIEDITADASSEKDKIQAEKPVSTPSGLAKTDESEIREIPSCEMTGNKIPKNSAKPLIDSESHQVQPNILRGRPLGESACPQVLQTNAISEHMKHLDAVSEAAPPKPVKTDDLTLPSAAPPNAFNETEFSLHVTASVSLESSRGKHVKDVDDYSSECLIAAFTETVEKEIVDTKEVMPEKMTDLIKTLPVQVFYKTESGNSEIKGIRSKCMEQNKETNGSEFPGAFPAPCAPVSSLDLEQEQLTIRALREIGKRQVERSASVQDKDSSEERPKQTVAPESWPQRPCDILEITNVKTGSDLGIFNKPTIFKETRVDDVPGLSRTGLVNKHALSGLLTDLSVHDLIFWRDVKKTGFVFGTTLIMLLSLAAFSVISVVSYLILALLSVTISFRVYKSVIQAVQKSEEGHPFKAYLDVDITLSSEAFHNYVNAAMVHINRALKLVIRLFLVEDLVDSLKLAVFMWLMTYVGAVFNGITLLILAELLVFSVPIVYEKYKTQIDHYVSIARDQTKSVVEKIQAKLPGIAKKKAE